MAKGTAVEETTAVTELSKEQKLALFESWAKAKKQCEDARAKADGFAKKIYEACGSGPYKYAGEEFVLVKQRGGDGVSLRSRPGPREYVPSEEIG